jgi:hypothetical protein
LQKPTPRASTLPPAKSIPDLCTNGPTLALSRHTCFVNRRGRKWPVWFLAGQDDGAVLHHDTSRGNAAEAEADARAAVAAAGLGWPPRWEQLTRAASRR